MKPRCVYCRTFIQFAPVVFRLWNEWGREYRGRGAGVVIITNGYYY